VAQQNANINIKNLNWLRNLKTVGPQGTIHGHLIAAMFDDVNTAYGQLAAKHAATQTALEAALARIAALEGK
jgi:acyl-coenzyme A thioesterase PaaI-like protein